MFKIKKSGEIEKYDHSHRILLYDTNNNGKCNPEVKVPELTSELADEWYLAKERSWQKIMKEIIEGKSSPVKLFIEYNHMTVEDTADRVGVSASSVRKHMTMEGFKKLDVKTLLSYSKVFNVPVGNLFQFIEYDGEVKIDSKIYHDGLIHFLKISNQS